MSAKTAPRPGGPDPLQFIAANMVLAPVPSLPEIRLYAAHPGTGLWRLIDTDEDEVDPPPPYWAYHWAGGAVLARHILDHSQAVAGKTVLDLGTGSGLVSIAAAKAGASHVTAADIDPNAIAAVTLNAAANGVTVTPIWKDFTTGAPPAVNIILVGDLFYAPDLAERVLAFLDTCLDARITVLIGDPGRAYLPLARLRVLAQYAVPDFGDAKVAAMKLSSVFALEPSAQA